MQLARDVDKTQSTLGKMIHAQTQLVANSSVIVADFAHINVLIVRCDKMIGITKGPHPIGLILKKIENERDNVKLMYKIKTRIGSFYIGKQDGRYHPIFDDESLGSYSEDWQAADDLAGGSTFSISSGIDTSSLGIPSELGEWEKIIS